MIPLILGAAALATGAFGIGAGVSGVTDMNKAKEIGEDAQRRYQKAKDELESEWKITNELAQDYGQLQFDVQLRTIGRFVAFIKRIGQNASQADIRFLEGLEITVHQLKQYETMAMEAQQFVRGGIGAAIAGAGAGQAATGFATSVGVASTGTAISGLSGAAATNATLAWLGGGSLAAGGGGMALGTVVLGGITVGPALAVGGFMLAGQGEKALTQARKYEAEVNKEIANLDKARSFLRQVQRRIKELESLVDNLNIRVFIGLNELESQPFQKKRDAQKFQQLALLVKALAEIIKTPVLDSEGKLNPATVTIQAKYRKLGDN